MASVVASAVFDVEGNAASRDLWWVVNARVFTTGSLPISRRLHKHSFAPLPRTGYTVT